MSDEPDAVADSDPTDVHGVEDASSTASAVPGDAERPLAPKISEDAGPSGQARKVPMGKGAADDLVEPESDNVADSEEVTESGAREAAVVGAASAGSARAAARRSGVRAGSTPAKGVATRPRDVDRDDRVGMFARLGRFFREVVAELRKVIWPARNQMITYTIVVIVFVVIMVALVAGLDVLFARGVLWIFG